MAENESTEVAQAEGTEAVESTEGAAGIEAAEVMQGAEPSEGAEPAEGAEGSEPVFEYAARVEEIGPGTKKVSVEIPATRIAEKLTKQYKELRQQAVIPGFRSGHAPQKLIERRFGSDVRDQVRRSLIGESYEQAIATNALQLIGEPEFEKPEPNELPAEGPLNYSFVVEVRPEITLPDLANLTVVRQKIAIKDRNIDQAMQNLREQQGALVPVEDRGVEANDYLSADVHLKVDGNVVHHQHDAQFVVRPGRVAGIEVADMATQLQGLKPGETRSLTVKAPENHPNEQLRGKEIQVEVALKDIKRLELAEVSAPFLEGLGFTNEADLRDALRQQMVEKLDSDVQQAMREQVYAFLLQNVTLQLPEKLSERQAERVINRRGADLMMRGVPVAQIEANVDRLRSGAAEEARQELKLFFILQKIAADLNIAVDEAELNGRIAMLAVQQGRRPEKAKQEMSKDGSLTELYVRMREQKAVDKILEGAKITEVEIDPDALPAPGAAAQGQLVAEPAASSQAPAAAEAPASGDAPAAG